MAEEQQGQEKRIDSAFVAVSTAPTVVKSSLLAALLNIDGVNTTLSRILIGTL